MAKEEFIVKLSSFVEKAWPNMRVGHSINAVDDRYPCANPDGPVDNSECPEDDPLCNCPCQDLNPGADASWWDFFGWFDTEIVEPTDEQLEESLQSIKECEYIKNSTLPDKEEWLGCLWNNQNHPSSCDCPCRGKHFKDYLEYTRTYATYWNTEKTTPLWREAQMFLINSQKAQIVLNGDLSLRPGTLIKIVNKIPKQNDPNDRRFGGRWLITSISHIIQNETHRMVLILARDSSPKKPEESTILGWFEDMASWFKGLFS